MKDVKLLLATVAILLMVGIASAAIEVNATEIGTNYIQWSWTETPIAGLNVDGRLVSTFDPAATSYILSNLNPNELHSITVYTSLDSGTNQTYTKIGAESGVWGYALLTLVFLAVGYYWFAAVCFIGAMVAFIGMMELVTRTDWSMSSGTSALIVAIYLFLIIICCLTWGFRSGRIGR